MFKYIYKYIDNINNIDNIQWDIQEGQFRWYTQEWILRNTTVTNINIFSITHIPRSFNDQI